MDTYIKDYNEWLIKQDVDQMSNGLLNGRMGLCVYWYQQSRIYSEKRYEKLADHILDKVLERIGIFTGIGIDDGLVGILLAINYLIRKQYIAGSVNNIFTIVDDKLFQYAYFRGVDPIIPERNNMLNLIWICIYFCQRIQSNSLSKENCTLVKRLICEIINSIEEDIREKPNIINEESTFKPFSYLLLNSILLVTEMYKMDLYTYKLNSFCHELSTDISSHMPIEYSNRYVVYYATRQLLSTGKCTGTFFNEIADVLHHIVNTGEIMKMFRCNDLSLREGLSGLLYYVHNDITDLSLLNNFKQKIIDNIQSGISTLWKNERLFTLGDGMSGVFYTYQKIILDYEKR